MGIGAVATLAAGLLAVGCSDDSDNGGGVIIGTGDTSPQSFTATSIQTNNLDSDGAGFSPNGTIFQEMVVKFANDRGMSDGTFGGDSSAMVLFRVRDNNSGNLQRVMASHYQGGNFTPPVELQAEDRNETVASNLQAAVMIQLATSAYGTASSQAVNDVRANNGNWLILWDYTTNFQDPRLLLNSTTTGAVGPHRTIGATVFLREFRGTAVTTSSKVGATPRTFRYGFQEVALEVPSVRTGATNHGAVGTTQRPFNNVPAANVTSFGLISNGFAGQASFGGTALPFSDNVQAELGRNDLVDPPGVSLVTDNAAGNYVFAHPNQRGATLRTASYEIGEQTNFIHLFYTQVTTSISGGGTFTQTGIAGGNGVDGGADLAAFNASFNMATLTFGAKTEFTPPVERNGSATALRAGTGFYPSFHVYNQHVFFKYADASLITNNVLNSNLLSLDPVAAQPLSQSRVFNHEGKSLAGDDVFYEDIIAYATVTDAGDGTSTLGAASAKRDLNFHGTAGAHDTTNPTASVANATNSINTLPNREMMNFNGSGQFIFGADEGLGDTTIFYLAADSTRAQGLTGDTNPTNIDATISVAVVNNDGSFAAGVNPRRVSVHKGDFHGQTDLSFGPAPGSNANASSDANTLQDPPVEQGALSGVGGTLAGRNGSAGSAALPAAAFATGNVTAVTAGTIPTYFRAAMNRTGEYVALNWIQDQGVSSLGGIGGGAGFYQALFATVYQTFRPAVTGTGTTTTAAAVEARFAAAPLEVSSGTGTLALSQNVTRSTNVQNNGVEGPGSWTGLPVNWSAWQGDLGYRCGFQSNRLIMNMFWEQSDGTEDRLFTRDITVTLGTTGTPTFALGTTAELEPTATVQGHESINQFGNTAGAGSGQENGPAVGSIDTFRFLEGGIYSFASTDLGPDATTLSATNQGGVLVVLGRVIDATTSDNDLADAEVTLYEILRGTATISAANKTSLSRNINENAATVAVQEAGAGGSGEEPTLGGAGTLTQLNSTNSSAANNYNGVFDTGSLLRIIATANNTDITGTNANFSPTRVDVIFSDSRTDNNSGARVLYARKYDSGDRRLTTPKANAGERLTPVGSVGATAPAEPTRLDRLQGGNVTAITTVDKRASSIVVVWTQDGHGWAQYTSDGTTYVTTAGAPTPPLVDDNNSENVITLTIFRGENASCDLVDGIALIVKLDAGDNAGGNADQRAYLRGTVTTR